MKTPAGRFQVPSRDTLSSPSCPPRRYPSASRRCPAPPAAPAHSGKTAHFTVVFSRLICTAAVGPRGPLVNSSTMTSSRRHLLAQKAAPGAMHPRIHNLQFLITKEDSQPRRRCAPRNGTAAAGRRCQQCAASGPGRPEDPSPPPPGPSNPTSPARSMETGRERWTRATQHSTNPSLQVMGAIGLPICAGD